MPPRKSALKRSKAATYKKRKQATDTSLEIGESSMVPTEVEAPPPKRKGRGPALLRDATEDVEERPIIWVVGKKEFTCEETETVKPGNITASITRLALNYMPGPLRSYHSWDLDRKNSVERAFLQRYRYREDQDVSLCRTVMDAIAAKRYTEELNKARSKCEKKFPGNVKAWKTMVPHWCLNPPNWVALCDIFDTEDWKELSKQNKLNRIHPGTVIPYYGGCASTHQHLKKLADVMDMRANTVNAHMDEGDLFMSAVGGRNHGRVRGFGCVLDPKLPKTIRGWATPTSSDISGVTNLGNKRVFTDDVLLEMLNERDMRLAEEKQERKIEGARCTMLLNKLVTLLGQQNPNVLETLYGSHALHQGVMGNMQTLQGQRPTSLPQSQEGGSLMQIPHSQGLPSLQASTNLEGGFQALLQANSGPEVASLLGAEPSMGEWFGQGNSDNNPL